MANKFKPGQEVVVNTREIPDKHGVVRFVGKIQGKSDDYVGIELEQPCGKNNGEFEGKVYFKVDKDIDKGQNYGVFVRPASVKLATEAKQSKPAKEIKKPKDLDEPKEAKEAKKAPTGPGRLTKTVQAPPQPPTPTANQTKAKLANELFEQQSNELHSTKEQLESAYQKIRQLEELDAVKEVEAMRGKLKELQEMNRTLRLDIEKVRYRSDSNQEQKLKQLVERLTFFQNQKESGEKERAQLKKKIERLEAELEEGADREEMLEKLTLKIEGLENKNEKLKADLETANTQLKNTQMLGSSGSKGQEALEEDVATLNEMIALLESDLKEEKEKTAAFEAEIQTNASKLNEFSKLQRRVKSRDEENELLKGELETYSDAANFVEKLTLDLIAKEQGLREQTKKLKQFAEQVNRLQNETVESQDMIGLQGQQMQILEQEIQKHLREKAEQQKHVGQLNDQINKYKQRIRELTDNNSSLLLGIEEKQDETTANARQFVGTDVYQHKYYELSKLHQTTLTNYLEYQLQTATTRHYAGTYLANLIDTLPEAFAAQLHPHLLALLLKITAANHKLYLLFDITAYSLTHKSELYAPENENTASWLLMLLEQIPLLYSLLLKIEMALVSADTEEEIMEIISHPELKDQVTRIDSFTQELLQRVTTETIDIEVEFDPYIDPVETLDKIALTIKKLPIELSTRLQLCSQTMRGVQQVLSLIELYRRKSQARESAQVDAMVQSFLKMLLGYLKECCMNPHIRLKSDMKSYLSGVDLMVKVLKEVQLSDSLQELGSLYSDTQSIKMLKDTLLTTQFHLKELVNDLQDITYSTPLSRIHVKLPGKLWQDRLKQMRDQLARFQTTLAQKEQLERIGIEQKRKVMILEKQIKDRQATKEVHERRIGELQLKVEQFGFLQSDFKRQGDKLRSLEEATKLIEEQLSVQSRRKKELEEELRKTKEKFDLFQTESVMKQKKQNTSTLSTEDVSNLAIFKTVVAEAGALRNHNAKRKLNQLAFSPILHPRTQPTRQTNTRREVLNSLVEAKIGESLSAIEAELSRAEFKVLPPSGQDYTVGCLSLRNVSRATLTVDVDQVGIASY